MRFPLQAAAKSLAILAGALVLAASVSGTALAHDAKKEGAWQQQSFDGRSYQGQRGWEDYRAGGQFRDRHDQYDKKRFKHGKRARHKHKGHGHGIVNARHDHRWRHGRRHSRGHGVAAARFDCRPVSKVGVFNGRPARIGGTGCFDAYGQFHMLPRSRYLIHYLSY